MGKLATKNFLDSHPELANQWHYARNYPIRPEDVTYGSGEKYWWKCSTGKKDHVWEATVNNRSKGTKCPFCSRSGKNPLLNVVPDLEKEWHPTKNGPLKPSDFSFKSHRQIWWQCSKIKKHVWKTRIQTRVVGAGCPICLGRTMYSLDKTHPHLVHEWHLTKNGTLTPKDVTHGSNKKIWWQCSYGHNWLTKIRVRTSGCNCPTCYELEVLRLRENRKIRKRY